MFQATCKIFAIGVVVSAALLTADLASAGTRDGGGGVGVRCPAGSGAPKNFELLDLQEARLNGLTMSANPKTQAAAVKLIAGLLANHVWYPDFFALNDLQNSFATNFIQPIFSGQSFTDLFGNNVTVQYVQDLPLSNDLGIYQILPGCQLEQVAYFDDQAQTLKIVQSRWQELDLLDQAALITHEVDYLFDRHMALENFGVSDTSITSMSARQFVGDLLSSDGLTAKFASLPSENYLECESDPDSDVASSMFFAYDSGPNQITFVFATLDGLESSFQTSVVAEGANTHDLWLGQGAALHLNTGLVIADERNAPQFNLQMTSSGRDISLQAFAAVSGQMLQMGPVQKIDCEMK